MKLTKLFTRISWPTWLMFALLIIVAWQLQRNFARGKQLSQLLEGAETMADAAAAKEGEAPKKSFWSRGGWGSGGESASATPAPADSSSSSSSSGSPSFSWGSSGFSSNQPQDVDDVLMQMTSMIVRDKSKLNLPTAKAKYEEMLVKADDYLTLQGLMVATRIKDMPFEKATDALSNVSLARMALVGILSTVKKM